MLKREGLSVDRAVALPLTTVQGNQVKVTVNYNVEDESLIGQRVNAIMGIYDSQTGSLIKLSSFPNGFILNNTEGTTQLATTLTDNILQYISAVVILTNSDKSENKMGLLVISLRNAHVEEDSFHLSVRY